MRPVCLPAPAAVVRAPVLVLALAVAAATATGCQSTYYAAMEQAGYHKRDIMVSRVQSARDAQQDAIEEFDSALDQFQSVVGRKGGSLQDKYDTLAAALERSESRAETVSSRIDSVESVSEALFSEWKTELSQYSNQELRRASERRMNDTRKQYEGLVASMRRAEKKIDPVLTVFRDQVLFLKHNLNAQAISSLGGELGKVETDVAALIADLKKSIAEADAFIATMEKG
jgi:hypothetical protein